MATSRARLLYSQYGAADRKIVLNQFKYLVNDKKVHSVMERYRSEILGHEHFPAIYSMSRKLRENTEKMSEASLNDKAVDEI